MDATYGQGGAEESDAAPVAHLGDEDSPAGPDLAQAPDPGLAEDRDLATVPEPPDTGDPEVGAALRALTVAVRGSLPDQVAGYEVVHRALQDRLADVEG